MKGYIGTYTTSRSKGIYQFEWDGHKLSKPTLFHECQNPKYLCMMNTNLVAVFEKEGQGAVMVLDRTGHVLDQLIIEDTPACFVDVLDGDIYTTNYHTGCVSRLSFDGAALTLEHQVQIQDHAGAHHISKVQDHFWVPCLLMNQIVILDKDLRPVDRIEMEPGAGPRHGVVCDSIYYVCGELSNRLYAIDIHSRKVIGSSDLMVSKTGTKGTAAIFLDQDKLYVSTRFSDVISVVSIPSMKLEQVVSSMGIHPRDFVLENHVLIAAHKDDDTLSVIHRDAQGYLGKRLAFDYVPEAVCIVIEEDTE